MDQDSLSQLKKEFAYETWRGSNTLQSNLFIWRFFLTGGELSGWRLLNSVSGSEASNPPIFAESGWEYVKGKDRTVLRLELLECESLYSAQEHLLYDLGRTPILMSKRRSEVMGIRRTTEIGDVCFGDEDDSTLFFTRANLHIKIKKGAGNLLSVPEFARRLDEILYSSPRRLTEDIAYPPQVGDSLNALVRSPSIVRLSVPETDLRGEKIWHKFFSRSGSFIALNGGPCFQTNKQGRNEIYIFAVSPNRGIERQRLSIKV
jgi:hypothetical protein